MTHDTAIMVVTQTRVQPNKNYEFEQWLQEVENTLEEFPGFISQEIKAPNPPIQLDWIIIQKFDSAKHAYAWLQSAEHHHLVQKIHTLLAGIDTIYIMQPGKHDKSKVTASISTIIHKDAQAQFLNWQARIAPLQSKYTGFLGYKLERPKPGITDAWVSTVTFDSEAHLEAWLNSKERKKMLEELNAISYETHIEKIYSGFDFWFSGKPARSVWKENMLVLLTLYPVVFALSFIQNPVVKLGVPFWLALFFSNAVSTVTLGSLTVPFLMRVFSWWLNPPQGRTTFYTILGTVIVIALYGTLLCVNWFISTALA